MQRVSTQRLPPRVPALRRGGDETRPADLASAGQRARINASCSTSVSVVSAPTVSAPFACKAGVCATRRAKVLSGTVEMKTNYGLSPEETAQGYVLTCQAAPTSEGVVVDYDA